MEIPEYSIKSLEEYRKIIDRLTPAGKQLWFRGHASANFSLEPSIHRVKKNIRAVNEKTRDFKLTRGDSIMPNEWALRNEFRKLYRTNFPDKEIGDMECLYLMQHYGILTRLLDFSTDPMVALYFALSERPFRIAPIVDTNEIFVDDYLMAGYDAAVYLIDPLVMNDYLHGFETVKEVNEELMPYLNRMTHPLAIHTTFTDARIVAQKGVFVLFGSMTHSLEYIFWKTPHINKIIIPNAHIMEIYGELRRAGTTHFSIYPDLKGKVLDLNEEMIENMNKSYAELLGDDTDSLW
jgi:hypothetical protein